ncbi:MAG: GIY-YIG nuclease family protein [Promethearchaeota archaeon]
MPFWVYMLFVGDQSHGFNRKIYTGSTGRITTRIVQHCGLTTTKGARLTRRQPIELVYLEKYSSRKNAMKREYQLKHESPFNQKKHKLMLIREFKLKNGQILQELNNKLIEHFEFLASLIKMMKSVEKRLINEIDIASS